MSEVPGNSESSAGPGKRSSSSLPSPAASPSSARPCIDLGSFRTAGWSREQLVALFARLVRTAESSIAVLESPEGVAQDISIEPGVLQSFVSQAQDWLGQLKQSWPHPLDRFAHSPSLSLDPRSPIQVSLVLERLHDLWKHFRPQQPLEDSDYASSATEGESADDKLPAPPLLLSSEGQITFLSPNKSLSDLGHMASDVAQELKDILSQEAGLLAHEAQIFKDAVTAGADRLLNYSELPQRYRNNQWIQRGYRFVPATRERLAGLVAGGFFSWHNELINIWTHTLGFFFCIYLMVTDLPHYPSESTADTVVAASFLISAACCLLLSTVWHIMAGCATWHLFNSSACLDYCGVSALITSSVFTCIWYGFYCEPQLLNIWSSTVFATGVLGIFLPFADWFNQREYKNWRIAFFLAMCGTAIGPQIHMIFRYGAKETVLFFLPALISASAYVVGLIFYGFNLPEVLKPGSYFDYVAHSHQFWHIAIVIAIYLQWLALKIMHERGTTSFSCGQPEPTLLEELSHIIRRPSIPS